MTILRVFIEKSPAWSGALQFVEIDRVGRCGGEPNGSPTAQTYKGWRRTPLNCRSED